MNGDITRKQRSRFFATNVAAFAFIFFLLGFITLQILNQSAYRETDLSLEKINFDSRTVQLEIQRYQQGDPFLNPTQTEQNRTNMEQPLMEPSNDRFNTQVILWSKNGEILNKAAIGGRFNQIKELKMDTKNLNTIQNIELNEDCLLYTSPSPQWLICPLFPFDYEKSGDESRWRCLHPNFRKYKSNQEFISDFSHDYDFVYDCFLDSLYWYQLLLV